MLAIVLGLMLVNALFAAGVLVSLTGFGMFFYRRGELEIDPISLPTNPRDGEQIIPSAMTDAGLSPVKSITLNFQPGLPPVNFPQNQKNTPTGLCSFVPLLLCTV